MIKKRVMASFLAVGATLILASCNSVYNSVDPAPTNIPDTSITSNGNSTTSNTTPSNITPEGNVDVDTHDYSDDWASRPIPSSFDLRSVDTDGDGVGDRCFVTPVKGQNPYGTCWGFGAISAAEISLLGSVYKNDPDAYKTLNLSEKQLAYFSHVPDPVTKEGMIPENYNDMQKIFTGGTPFLATSTFAQGVGPSNESFSPYFEYHGINELAEEKYIDGKYQLFSYSDKDDWTIPGEYKYHKDYLLKESICLPSPAIIDNKKYIGHDADAVIEIKKQLLQKRGVEIGFCADSSSPNQDLLEDGVYITTKTWAHYTWQDEQANHAVTIVGWDDNYSKENFIQAHQPEANGAWLCKNSWGSGEVEFPNKITGSWGIKVPLKDSNGNVMKDEKGDPIMVGSGYFWLSYYDKSLLCPETFVFTDEVYDTVINQHDYMPVNAINVEKKLGKFSMSNVFKADYTQLINAISCQTASPNMIVDYQLYLLPETFKSPVDGIKVYEGEQTYEYAGYHHIEIPEILVQKNQNYSVVMSVRDSSGNYYLNTPFGGTLPGLINSYSTINKNESFILEDGKWTDYKDYSDNILKGYEQTDEIKIYFDNFPIKTYSARVAGDIYYNIKLISDKLALGEGTIETTATLSIVVPSSYSNITDNVEWNVLEESKDIVSITPTATPDKIIIKALKTGRALISVKVGDYGIHIFEIKVVPLYPETVLAFPYYTPYTGEEIKPQVLVSCNRNIRLTGGIHYDYEYIDNINCGVAKVKVTGKDGYVNPDNPGPVYGYFAITPGKTEISVEGSDNSIKVNVNDMWSTKITGYKVSYRLKGNNVWIDAPDILNNHTSIVIDGLEKGEYEVRACAYLDTTSFERNDLISDLYLGDYSDISTITI